MKRHSQSTSDIIWDEFIKFIHKKGIAPKYSGFYLNWAKKFLRYNNHEIPSGLANKHINDFRIFLTQSRKCRPWQIEQAVRSVKLLDNFLLLHKNMLVMNSKEIRNKSFADRTLPDTAANHKELLIKLRTEIRYLHYSHRTEHSYRQWIVRFLTFHKNKPLNSMASNEIRDYLEYLAVERKVSASTQNQALNAIVFLFKKVLKRDPGIFEDFTRARRPVRLPVVLSKDEAKRLIDALPESYKLIAGLLYGSGLRIMECLRLRIKDIDFEQAHITVREGKGQKDRITLLPEKYHAQLSDHLKKVCELHKNDIEKGHGEVYIPENLARKYPGAPKEWIWQYVFPSGNLSVDPESGKIRRHHVHENVVQRNLKNATVAAGINKRD